MAKVDSSRNDGEEGNPAMITAESTGSSTGNTGKKLASSWHLIGANWLV